MPSTSKKHRQGRINMSDKSIEKPLGDDWARALGRIPSGLFILTARFEDQSTGMLASWVQQVSFDPPLVSVAVKKGRFVANWLVTNPYSAQAFRSRFSA
jgi:hypothetical protein